MPLEFLHTRFRFHMASRSVQMAAISNGVPLKVIIGRATLEHIAGARNLSEDESLTVAAQNLELLRLAAGLAAEGWRGPSPIVSVAPWDVIACAKQQPPKPLLGRITQHQAQQSTPSGAPNDHVQSRLAS